MALLKDNVTPVLFLEPSCYSMFADDYRELGFREATDIAKNCWLIEDFLENLLQQEPDALRFRDSTGTAAVHAHCHTKALAKPATQEKLLRRIPGLDARTLPTACCGMAGSYGVKRETYAWSQAVGKLYADALNQLDANCHVVASGTSCRQQALHLTDRTPRHLVEVLAAALE